MKDKDKVVASRLTSVEYDELLKLADKDERTMSNYIRIIIKDWIKKHKEEK